MITGAGGEAGSLGKAPKELESIPEILPCLPTATLNHALAREAPRAALNLVQSTKKNSALSQVLARQEHPLPLRWKKGLNLFLLGKGNQLAVADPGSPRSLNRMASADSRRLNREARGTPTIGPNLTFAES